MSCPHLLCLVEGNSLWGLVWLWVCLVVWFFFRIKIALWFFFPQSLRLLSFVPKNILSGDIGHSQVFRAAWPVCCWKGEMASQLPWVLLHLWCLHLSAIHAIIVFLTVFFKALNVSESGGSKGLVSLVSPTESSADEISRTSPCCGFWF